MKYVAQHFQVNKEPVKVFLFFGGWTFRQMLPPCDVHIEDDVMGKTVTIN